MEAVQGVGAETGILYVVGTPIGNLGDLTPRAKEVLLNVPVVVCEDTRRTGRLLSAVGAKARLISCFEHKEARCAQEVVRLLLSGTNCAFCTDAGTPNVSDPGRRVIEKALREGVRLVPIPGVSAVTTILSCSPFRADRFYFAGFLPEKAKNRRDFLMRLRSLDCPIVFFEAPHRMRDSLEDVLDCLGDRELMVGRELTKLHEEVRLTTVKGLRDYFLHHEPRGEFTFCIEGASVGKGEAVADEEKRERLKVLLRLIGPGLENTKEVSKALSALTGLGRSEVYQLIIEAKARAGKGG